MPNLAIRNLLHDRLRSAMTIAGVAFAVTLVFVQVGLFLGILDNASITIEHIGADLITRYIVHRQGEQASNGTINRDLGVLRRMLRLGLRARKLVMLPPIDMLKEAPPRSGFFPGLLVERMAPEAANRAHDLLAALRVAFDAAVGGIGCLGVDLRERERPRVDPGRMAIGGREIGRPVRRELVGDHASRDVARPAG